MKMRIMYFRPCLVLSWEWTTIVASMKYVLRPVGNILILTEESKSKSGSYMKRILRSVQQYNRFSRDYLKFKVVLTYQVSGKSFKISYHCDGEIHAADIEILP